LSKHSNIIGIKEASGDLAQAKDIIRLSAEKFFVTSGDDVLAPAMTLSGGVGVISVLANAYPAEFSQMISHFVNGQSEQGKILEDKLYSFHDCMYSEGNPSGIKTAMEILGVCSADVRLPLTRVSSDLHRKLVELVKNL
jgi:4-hydroxy-tetrahydrodipicolinate synthase